VTKVNQALETPACNNSLSKTASRLPIRTVTFVTLFGKDVTEKYFKLTLAELNLK
jgi:hypothetical protein